MRQQDERSCERYQTDWPSQKNRSRNRPSRAIHLDLKQFGVDVGRIEMKLPEFLDGLSQKDGEWRHLTTR